MKKTKLFAAISAAMLLSSILIPTVAFGQGTESQQTGSQEITGGALTFTNIPGEFGFDSLTTTNVVTNNIHCKTLTGNCSFSNIPMADNTEHLLSVQDLRGDSSVGFTVDLSASGFFSNGSDTISLENGTNTGYYIGMGTSGLDGFLDANTSSIMYSADSQNHEDYSVVEGNSDLALENNGNQAYDENTYTQTSSTDLNSILSIMEMTIANNTEGFTGTVSTGIYDLVKIPPFQAPGTYNLTKVYTLTALE